MELDKDAMIKLINKVFENAESLFSDALFLEQNNRLSRAFTLYQLCNEEIGKAVIYYVALAKNQFPILHKNLDKEVRNHISKSDKATSIDIILLMMLRKNTEASGKYYNEYMAPEKGKIKELNDLKNLSLYTTLLKGKFVNPNDIITKEIVSEAKNRANMRLNFAKDHISFHIEHIDAIAKTFNR